MPDNLLKKMIQNHSDHKNYKNFHKPYTEKEQKLLDAAIDIKDGHEQDPWIRQGDYYVNMNDSKVKKLIPSLQAELEIALQRAEQQLQLLDQSGGFPEGLGDLLSCEGIDPKGHYTSRDLQYARRILALKHSIKSASPQVRANLRHALRKLETPGTAAHRKRAKFFKECRQVRLLQRAAKLSPNDVVAEKLYAEAEQEVGTDYESISNMLRGLEYMAGLSTASLTNPEISIMKNLFHLNPSELKKLHEQRFERHPQSQPVTIDFPNIENILTQLYLAHPAHWGERAEDAPNDWKDPEIAAAALQLYAPAVVSDVIDGIYLGVESLYPTSNPEAKINRTKLIIVNGKTIEEIMKIHYLTLGKPDAELDAWILTNMVKLTASIVAAALMAGRVIEAFITGEDGKVKENPIQIYKTGYTPTPLKPTMYRIWDKFCLPFGGIKNLVIQQGEPHHPIGEGDTVDQHVMDGRHQVISQNLLAISLLLPEREQQMSKRKAQLAQAEEAMQELNAEDDERDILNLQREQDRRRAYTQFHCANPEIRGQFTALYRKEHPELQAVPDSAHLRCEGSVMSSICLCRLLMQGDDPLDQILDHTKLLEEKGAIGKEFIAWSEGKTQDQIHQNEKIAGEWIYHGQKKLLAKVDEKLKEQDLSKLMDHHDFPIIVAALQLGCELSQNKASPSIIEGYLAAAQQDFYHHPELQEKLRDHPAFQGHQKGAPLTIAQKEACAEQTEEPLRGLNSIFNLLRERTEYRLDPERNPVEKIAKEVMAATVQNELQLRKQQAPNQPVSSLFPATQVQTYAKQVLQSHREGLMEIALTKTQCDRLSKLLRTNEFRDKIQTFAKQGIQYDPAKPSGKECQASIDGCLFFSRDYLVTFALRNNLRNRTDQISIVVKPLTHEAQPHPHAHPHYASSHHKH